jgi:glycosyltransferase involved in cell wall biosynthesis
VLVPTAHDEGPIGLNAFRLLFRLPRGLGFLTPEERDFVVERFHVGSKPHAVLGTGIDLDRPAPTFVDVSPPREPFVLYVGRIEQAKGLPELFEHFQAFKRLHGQERFVSATGEAFRGADLKLVLAGRAAWLDVPKRDDVVALGFVSDADKGALLARCELLVLPSRYESLSIVLLEAWAASRPVLVNGACAVTAGQVRRASGGACYHDERDFARQLAESLRDPPLRRRQGAAGRDYVAANYAWPSIEQRLLELLERAMGVAR